jgi:hypothetical protein
MGMVVAVGAYLLEVLLLLVQLKILEQLVLVEQAIHLVLQEVLLHMVAVAVEGIGEQHSRVVLEAQAVVALEQMEQQLLLHRVQLTQVVAGVEAELLVVVQLGQVALAVPV